MNVVIAFVAGLMLGGSLGVLVACLCVTSGRADDAPERRPADNPTNK